MNSLELVGPRRTYISTISYCAGMRIERYHLISQISLKSLVHKGGYLFGVSSRIIRGLVSAPGMGS